MYNDKGKSASGFPDPLASAQVKEGKEYGLSYAKAIYKQWGNVDQEGGLYNKRSKVFARNRDYANGTQDTKIYKQLLNTLDPNNGDGSMLNLDFTPVPILPKFVRIVVNKILSLSPYPNLEAIDPLSSSEKDAERRKTEMLIQQKETLRQIKQKTGVDVAGDLDSVPETLEEAEIFLENNIKSSSEIAAQIATNMTLSWNDFNDTIYRRSVNDMATIGMAVIKRSNDPSYGIKTDYVDPANFIHSYTEDPSFSDLVYAGHVRRMPIQELRRIASDQFTDEEYKEIAKQAQKKYGYDASKLNQSSYDAYNNASNYGFDEYMIEVLDFEFTAVDCIYFEEKESKYGNQGFYMKGDNYKAPLNSVYERSVEKLENAVIYGGCYVLGTDFLFNYGKEVNIPKNVHDISKATLSYSACATNMLKMMPKSMVDSCIGFADQIQLAHLKLQQSVAKAKPDGIIIDIEGLENVQLGKGGELQPLELQVMDASSPKGDALVGVRQQALAAGNNAIYDITNSSMVLYKKVCQDVVKCLQVIHPESILYRVYENAIGKENMRVLSSFRNLSMYNFGVNVVKEMEETEKQYLEQNIQISLSQKELDLEDAMAVRQLKDVNQAERLLVVRRKKRIAMNQQIAMQNSQQQAQIQQASAQAASQGKMQEMQMEAQIATQEMQLKAQLEAQLESVKHEFRKEIEMIKAQATLGFKEDDENFKQKLEVLKEDRKDDRVKKQAVEQSKLLSQRQEKRGELPDDSEPTGMDSQLLGGL